MKAKQNFEGHFYFHLERAIRKNELLITSFPLINNIFHTLHVTHNVFRDRNIHEDIVWSKLEVFKYLLIVLMEHNSL